MTFSVPFLDGKTYENECLVDLESCRTEKPLSIIYSGDCQTRRGKRQLHLLINLRCIFKLPRQALAALAGVSKPGEKVSKNPKIHVSCN